jgi:hypothetical protein
MKNIFDCIGRTILVTIGDAVVLPVYTLMYTPIIILVFMAIFVLYLIIGSIFFIFGGNFSEILSNNKETIFLILKIIAGIIIILRIIDNYSISFQEIEEENEKNIANEKEIQEQKKKNLEYNKKNFGGEIFPPTFGVHYEDDEIGEVFYHENQEPDDHEPDNGEGFIIFQKSGSKKIYMSEYLIINESYWYTWYPNPFNSDALSEAVRSASENEHLATVFENRESAIDFLKTSGKSYERLLPKKGV